MVHGPEFPLAVGAEGQSLITYVPAFALLANGNSQATTITAASARVLRLASQLLALTFTAMDIVPPDLLTRVL
jgi:hypothetical protein